VHDLQLRTCEKNAASQCFRFENVLGRKNRRKMGSKWAENQMVNFYTRAQRPDSADVDSRVWLASTWTYITCAVSFTDDGLDTF